MAEKILINHSTWEIMDIRKGGKIYHQSWWYYLPFFGLIVAIFKGLIAIGKVKTITPLKRKKWKNATNWLFVHYVFSIPLLFLALWIFAIVLIFQFEKGQPMDYFGVPFVSFVNQTYADLPPITGFDNSIFTFFSAFCNSTIKLLAIPFSTNNVFDFGAFETPISIFIPLMFFFLLWMNPYNIVNSLLLNGDSKRFGLIKKHQETISTVISPNYTTGLGEVDEDISDGFIEPTPTLEPISQEIPVIEEPILDNTPLKLPPELQPIPEQKEDEDFIDDSFNYADDFKNEPEPEPIEEIQVLEVEDFEDKDW
ncbi:MAG: hypothetical protein ACRC4M_01105 [Mycoplasma sp.]